MKAYEKEIAELLKRNAKTREQADKSMEIAMHLYEREWFDNLSEKIKVEEHSQKKVTILKEDDKSLAHPSTNHLKNSNTYIIVVQQK